MRLQVASASRPNRFMVGKLNLRGRRLKRIKILKFGGLKRSWLV
ncbi:UNVERIFIED_CONTAM: hypothetical protein GTU68_060177 [Idotea baltica]|nr:hypothetical protein [Idotea baltica]